VEAFLASIGCRPGTQVEVAEQLMARDEVRFAALVAGSYDIIVELIVHAGPAGYPRTFLEMQRIPGVERWHSDLILHTYKISHDWSRQLLDADDLSSSDYRPSEPHLCSPEHLDRVDRAILAAFGDDGRANLNGIAGSLKLNESTVRRRFERMVADGCAMLTTLVPAAALGFEAETMLQVGVEPAKLTEVAHALARHRAVRYLGATLDGNSLLCEVIAPSTKGLFEFITRILARLDGVVGWSALVELLCLKRGFVETPWWRAQLADPHAVLRTVR
jgi:DNA-binding Lrp family transcriptional regulator